MPSLPTNTIILTPLTTVTTVPPGTTITIGCVDGYYTDQVERLTCGTDGQWTGTHTQCTGMYVLGKGYEMNLIQLLSAQFQHLQ